MKFLLVIVILFSTINIYASDDNHFYTDGFGRTLYSGPYLVKTKYGTYYTEYIVQQYEDKCVIFRIGRSGSQTVVCGDYTIIETKRRK